MSLEGQAIVQGLHNRVNTQTFSWAQFGAQSYLGYKDAYDRQTTILETVKKSTELSNERCWMVFTVLFTMMSAGGSLVTESLGEWAGRLLEPPKMAPDIADELFHKTVDLMSDNLKDRIKDSMLGTRAEGGGESSPWKPVVDDPSTYDGKMRDMLDGLAAEIMKVMDDLVSKSASWSVSDATAFVSRFEASCPYLTDLPVLGDQFKAAVAKTAETAMWIEWADARDKGWWEKDDRDFDGNALVLFDPVLTELTTRLGVPENDITSMRRLGSTLHNEPAKVLDMLKLIEWAKRNKAHKARTWTNAQLARAHLRLAPQVRTQDQLQCYREP
jgi:hypothetical protein